MFINLQKTTGRNWIIFLTAICLILSACSIAFDPNSIAQPRLKEGQGEIGTRLNNGEQIYFTATNTRGERITYTEGPDFGGMMMGNYLTCASCHGPAARGGLHRMHMQVMDAPDIRYSALSKELEEHAEDNRNGEHQDEHAEYDLEDFRRAVVLGQHPDGEPLSHDMPRWRINNEDLIDLFEFLKTIP